MIIFKWNKKTYIVIIYTIKVIIDSLYTNIINKNVNLSILLIKF